MANTVNTKFNTGIIKFTFSNEDGKVFSSCRMNPTDVRLLKRAEEFSQYFEKRKDEISGHSTPDELEKFNDEIQEKLNLLLGYDAGEELFGVIPATTISPDGDVFVVVIIDAILEALGPDLEKRKENMKASVSKYTDKYTK